MHASGQGYIETENPALMSLVVGRRSPGAAPTKMSGVGNGKSTERYATFSEVYGPYREDSMELKEERAYQRGMMEHIRENMDSIDKLKLRPDPMGDTDYQQRDSTSSSPMVEDGDLTEGPWQGARPDQFNGGSVATIGTYHGQVYTEDYFSHLRRVPTYLELAKNTSRRLPPPPLKSYAELSTVPKNYSEMRTREVYEEEGKTAPSMGVTYLQKNPLANTKFGNSSLPIEWKASSLPPSQEELWELRSKSLGKFAQRDPRGYNRSLDLNTSRIPHGSHGNSTFPLATVRLPALSNAQSLPSLNTVDRYQGNANPGRFNIDINLNMMSPRGDDAYGQNNYGSELVHGNYYNSVPPLVLNSLPALPPVSLHSQSSVPIQYQPVSKRNSVQFSDQMANVTPGTGSTIYPYRQMNNPYFPPKGELPTVRKNMRKGKYGSYRVFDIHDYKKLQKELRLGSLVGEEKDVETIQEKKEKRAILQEYGRLVRAKNREEMRPQLPL